MSDNANAVGSITVNQAAQSFATMLDSQEGVDTSAEAQPEEEQSESESEEVESAETQDETEESSEEVEGEEEEAEEEVLEFLDESESALTEQQKKLPRTVLSPSCSLNIGSSTRSAN